MAESKSDVSAVSNVGDNETEEPAFEVIMPIFKITDGVSIDKGLNDYCDLFKNYLEEAEFPTEDDRAVAQTFFGFLESAVYYCVGGQQSKSVMRLESKGLITDLMTRMLCDGLQAIFAISLKDQDGIPGTPEHRLAAIKIFKTCGLPLDLWELRSRMVQMVAAAESLEQRTGLGSDVWDLLIKLDADYEKSE